MPAANCGGHSYFLPKGFSCLEHSSWPADHMPLWFIHLAADAAAVENPLLKTEVIVAVVACFGLIITGLLTFLGVKLSSGASRSTHIETRLEKSELVNKGLWIWCIGLQAQIQRGDPPPPLPAPDWLQTLLDK